MYAFGIILFQLMTGSLIPADQSDIVHFTQRKHNFPLLFFEMVIKSVEYNPSKRASSSQMLKWLESKEMDHIQLQLAIDLGEFVSIFRIYYSETHLSETPNIKRHYVKLKPIKIPTGVPEFTELKKGEMCEFREEPRKCLPTSEHNGDYRVHKAMSLTTVGTNKELSLEYKNISHDQIIMRKMIRNSNNRFINSQTLLKNMSTVAYYASYYASSIFSMTSPNENEGNANKYPIDENVSTINCNHSCQICVSFDKPITNPAAKYTQKNPRLLTMLSFNNHNDGSIKQFDSTHEVFNARINAMCIVKNTIWLGFDKGEIRVYANLKEIQSGTTSNPIYSGSLGNKDNSRSPTNIYDLKYLEEWMCVLVSTEYGNIYFIYEEFHKKGKFCLMCNISPHSLKSVNRFEIVHYNESLQIWCTRGDINNPLSVIYLSGAPDDNPQYTTQHIIDARHIDQPMREITSSSYSSTGLQTYVWTAQLNRSNVCCWRVDNCKYSGKITVENPASGNNNRLNAPIVKSLLAVKEKLFVGTLQGNIHTFNCETKEPIFVYRWFIGPIKQIILFPSDIEGCLNKNSFFPINVENVNQKTNHEMQTQSMLLGALGEGLHILRDDDSIPEFPKNHMMFTIWRELEYDSYSDQYIQSIPSSDCSTSSTHFYRSAYSDSTSSNM